MLTIVLAVAVFEGLGFVAFGYDKAQARRRGDRVSERTLLGLCVIGGVGAWAGQQLFRHKTRKEPFRSQMAAMVALHLAGLGLLGWLYATGGSAP